MSNLDGHFWLGSLCRESINSTYPHQVAAVSDIITITEDFGRSIPDNSWMLYLLEFYLDEKEIPVELDLVCSFDDDGEFNAVFGGNNQYAFKIPPTVGHSYVREIVADGDSNTVKYILNDLNAGKSETFELSERSGIKGLNDISKSFGVKNLKDIKFVGTDHFTGIEWHNRASTDVFPIRYSAMISLLQYGKLGIPQSKIISYAPYRSLIPDKDGDAQTYPISFQNIYMRGCICYNVKTGSSSSGMEFAL